jgi:hypothetical protein
MPKHRRLNIRSTSLALSAGIAAIAIHQVGCSSSPQTGAAGQHSSTNASNDQTGTISAKLTLPGGSVLSTIAWTITGPNGAATVVQQGTVAVQDSTVISFVQGGIPAGSNYTISLTGKSTDGTVTCAGSAQFSITAHATSQVSVLLQCHSPGPDSGTAAVNGQTFACATADSISASPSETTVGHTVALTGMANGPDAANLTYAWSAPSGTFSSPNSASTNFTCTAPGTVTVTLTTSDGPVPAGASCDPTTATTTVQIQCSGTDAGAATACSLGKSGQIKHVIYLQFDNTHLMRDRAGVPSDLEQMPHLLNFIRGNGTMMANDHTILISHTAGGILTSLTGLYPDRHGQTVSNSYVRTSSTGTFGFPSSFTYWTDPAAANTTIPNMVGPDGSNVPAPWVTYTRAGCDFGAVASANVVLENTGTGANGDVTKVFGTSSPQFAEATASASAASGTAARAKAQTDLVGFAVHCALGSANCASGEPDVLPQEPGGYNGFFGLFGAQQVDPLLTGQAATVPVTDLSGNPITDPFGQPGFPGFDGMQATVSLGYVAAMQEHGIPVTYAYISDAHDNHSTSTPFGPGQAGYVQQLQAYDAAFNAFFTRLATDGIDKTNTLFIFTVDEGDHFVGGTPTPPDCDGVTTPCDWTNQIGEMQVNIDKLVAAELPTENANFLAAGAPDTFTVHGDDAPPFYLARRGVGSLSQTDPDTRDFERNIPNLTVVNQYNGRTDHLLDKMVDQAGMKALHMITTGDPARNATFTLFGDPDYFITDFPSSTCLTCIGTGFAWNHGDIQPEIASTWLGFVGPGVASQGDSLVFTDHTDVRPTINAITGLHDSYILDGRVITQAFVPSAVPAPVAGNQATVETLGAAYKEINAPFGPFAASIVAASTVALAANDATYTSIEASITNLTSQRDTLAVLIRAALDGAEFGNTAIDSTQAQAWITQAQQLLSSAAALAASAATVDAGAADAGAAPDAAPAADAGAADATVDATTPDATAPDATANDAAAVPDASSTPDASTAINLEVYRVGDGVGTLANTGNPVFVDEFSSDGLALGSIAMPTVLSGANHRLVASGTATAEGLITRSVDGKFLLVTGYDIAIPAASNIVATAAATNPRVVGRIDAAGDVDTTTALTDFADGSNPRCAVSVDGSSFWVTGAAGGIHFATFGGTTSTQLSTTVTNLRQAEIFGGQLFVSDASGSAVRIGTVGQGLPTTAGQTITNLAGFPLNGSPYGFFFADLDASTPGLDVLYVADDSVGLSKYSLVGGLWTLNGTIGTGTDLYRGLTAVVNGTSVSLFAVRGGSQLVSLADSSGYNGAFAGAPTVLATAGTNMAFRGVALAPQP